MGLAGLADKTYMGLAGLQQYLWPPFLKTTLKVSAFRTFPAYRYHTELNGENQLFQLNNTDHEVLWENLYNTKHSSF